MGVGETAENCDCFASCELKACFQIVNLVACIAAFPATGEADAPAGLMQFEPWPLGGMEWTSYKYLGNKRPIANSFHQLRQGQLALCCFDFFSWAEVLALCERLNHGSDTLGII